ncbi:MAG: WD40-like repeat-like protein [Verrucomicrobiales bacterium]|nr:WD40-like repeat-like protein [Verrucomicrobiales bacterium]
MKNRTLGQIRAATLLFPPLGLVWLWGSKDSRMGKKILGSFGIALYSLIYGGLLIFLMVKFAGMEVEFRGGYIPAFTFHKTRPDYQALEANRRKQLTQSETRSNPSAQSSYWNGFRGPLRDGHYREQSIATNWPKAGLQPVWHQPVGGGYASFAIAAGRAFTIEQRREQEMAVAYDVGTGRELWTQGWAAEFKEELGGDGPRATPAVDGERVYFLGALGELRCLEAASGKQIWRRNILDENHAPVLAYGTAASPLIVDDKVIVTPGGPNGHSVAAYSKTTGQPLWHAQNDEASYSSPMEVNLAGQRHLLVICEKRAIGLSLKDGALLWESPWIVQAGNRNIAQPLLLSSNRFFLSAGYGTGCAAVEITKEGESLRAREIWRNNNLKNKFTSSVVSKGYIYGLDEDILVCLNAETGRREWKDGRYGYGQMLLASEHLLILSGDGELALVPARPTGWSELCRFPAIRGKTWNIPALGGGKLLVRNSFEMACFDLGSSAGQ